MSVIDVVKKFLLDQEYVIQDEVLDETDSLLERGLIDSVGIINLVSLSKIMSKAKSDDRNTIRIPWGAWHGDDMLDLSFPSLWEV